ncbi:MAG: asparaginase [Firmicutes bacterium]|nr:asparaginase [Bacillota bacterium]
MKKILALLLCLALVFGLAACGEKKEAEPAPAPAEEQKEDTLPTVVILGTGGTIAGTGEAGKTTGYSAGELDVQSLIDGVPGLDKLATLKGEQVLNTASDNVTAKDWIVLAKRINELAKDDSIAGFVITHGTDTLEETAYFLDLTVKTDKPVICVGAMRPATATSADGPMNLYQSVALARTPEAKGRGVMVVFSDGIYAARQVTKVTTYRTDAFNGRDFGALGYMVDDKAYFYNKSEKPNTVDTPFDVSELEDLPKVGIAYFHIDAELDVLEHYLDSYEGVIVAGAGNGSMSTLWHNRIKERVDGGDGVIVVRAGRMDNGIVTEYATNPQTIAGNNLNPQKARILLSLALTVTKDREQIREYFATY